jgi:elongation factor G
MSIPLENKRNIAILAHVNAGKTTLSERLLYFSAAISGTGEVEEGLATMDYLQEEKKRGITIEAGIASYTWKGVHTTFVDTPGHVDFGAEVDFALQSVEGAVLVISGLSGIESQTLAAWEKIRSNGNLPLVFINKFDLDGADHGRVLEQMRLLFKTEPVVLTFPLYAKGKIDGVIDVVHELALFRSSENPRKLLKGEIPEASHDEYIRHRTALINFASRHNDAVMHAFLEGRPAETSDLIDGVRAGLAAGEGVPVFMGSALKNAGVRQLLNGINQLLPPPALPADADDTLGFVLKVRWYPGIGKIHLAKIFSDDTARRLREQPGGARFFHVFAETLEEIEAVEAGDVAAIQSDTPYVMGQYLLSGGARALGGAYKPLLQARIELADAADLEHVRGVLRQVADTEPSIQIESDTATGGWIVRAIGELQLDVFCKRLKNDHGCNISVGTPSVRYAERLAKTQTGLAGEATAFGAQALIRFDAKNRPKTDENRIRLPAGLDPVEEEVLRDCFRTFCGQGVAGLGEIAGLDLEIQEISGSRRPVPPPLLAKTFSDALGLSLNSAKFEVFEPIMNLEIIVPEEYCGAVLADLSTRGGVIRKIDADGRNSIIFLEIPLENVFGYATLLRSLSKGMGVFVLTYEKHGVRKRN